MRRSATVAIVVAAVALAGPGGLADAPPARAGLGSFACGLLGKIGEGWWGSACDSVLSVGGKVLGAGKKAASLLGKLGSNPLLRRAAGIAALVAWVLGGAKWTLSHITSLISATTGPTLTAGWFTGVYLRVEAIALFFTLLFICAAAAESVLRSETGVLGRSIFVYLPLAALLTGVAAPLTMLLLAATDQLSAGLEAVAGNGLTHFLTGTTALVAGGLTLLDPFFAVMAGGLVVAAGGALWVEMLIREVAVYVVVALLPIVFAGMVWPARRVWAIRAVEVLIALILSKVVIVAVLALGGAALEHAGASGLTRLLGGLALVILGAFSPWVLLRLIPLAEVASAAVGHVRGHVHATAGLRTPEATLGNKVADRVRTSWAGPGSQAGEVLTIHELLEQMHRRAQAAENGGSATHGPPGGQEGPNGAATSNGGTSPPTTGAGGRSAPAPPDPIGSAASIPEDPLSPRSPGVATDPARPARPSPLELPRDIALEEEAPREDAPAPPPPPDPQDGLLSPDTEQES